MKYLIFKKESTEKIAMSNARVINSKKSLEDYIETRLRYDEKFAYEMVYREIVSRALDILIDCSESNRCFINCKHLCLSINFDSSSGIFLVESLGYKFSFRYETESHMFF